MIASLRRGGRVSVPRGGTQLQAGDALTLTLERAAQAESLRALMGTPRKG